MANLKTCSRCKSEVDRSYFGLNRKQEPYKTCVNCRSKTNKKSITCVNTDAVPLRSDVDFVDAGKTVHMALGDIELMVNIIRHAKRRSRGMRHKASLHKNSFLNSSIC